MLGIILANRHVSCDNMMASLPSANSTISEEENAH